MDNLPAIIPTPPGPPAPPPGALRVVACPHPFRQAHEERYLIPGQSLLSILLEVQPDIHRYRAHVWVNEVYIPESAWAGTYPAAGAEIAIRVAPQGEIGRIIGSIFIAIAAIAVAIITQNWYVATYGASWIGTMLGGAAGLVVSVVGNLILNALIPPAANPNTQRQLQNPNVPTYSITGSSNQTNPYGPVPKVLGRVRVYPLKGARDYTQFSGLNQYLYCLFVWGYGPIQIEDLRIGETPIANFQSVSMQHLNLTYKDPQGNLTVYGNDTALQYTQEILETDLAIELVQSIAALQTSEVNADALCVEITFPDGLTTMDQYGSTYTYTVQFQVNYRRSGSNDPWIAAAGIDSLGNCILNGNLYISANSRSSVSGSLNWQVGATGQWDVQVTRIQPGNDNVYTQSVSYWTALQTIRFSFPLNFPQPLAVTSMCVLATGQLNGALQQFSGIATSICPDWDPPSQTWISRATQNPASLAREWLQGAHKMIPFLDAELDLPRFQDFWEYCDSEGWKYNKCIDTAVDWFEGLVEILAAGRAARTWLDGLMSLIIDRVQPFTIGPAWTPRNSSKYQFQITYPDTVHAWRIAFKNEQLNFADDERVVLDDGFQMNGLDAWGNAAPTLPEATIFQQLPLQGITDPALIFRHGRYHIAVVRLRFEAHSFTVSVEQLVATRGDRIKFAQDVILVGLAVGRVKSLVLDPSNYLAGITVDEPCPMEAGGSYGIRFALQGHATLYCALATAAGDNYQVNFAELLAPPNPPAAGPWPEVGDIFMFGEAGTESIDLVLNKIRPNNDLSALISAETYDENLYLADQGTIPPHNPNVTNPADWDAPVVIDVDSGDTVLLRLPDGSWQSRILVAIAQDCNLDPNVVGLKAQFRVHGGVSAFWTVGPVSEGAGQISLMPVEDGQTYDFQLCFVKTDGSLGPWSGIYTNTVIGKTGPPANVGAFQVVQVQQIVNFTWAKNPDLDLAAYELRYGPVGVSWDQAAVITEVMHGTCLATPLIGPGTWDFLIKAVDSTGNYSTTATRQTFMVTNFYSKLSDILQSTCWWLGTLENLVRDPRTGWLLPQDQNIPSGNDFEVFDNFVVNPFSEYSYTSPEIDLGANLQVRAWSRLFSQLGPGCSGAALPDFQFESRMDGGAYAGFQDWSFGNFTGRYCKFKALMEAANGLYILTEFETTVDQSII